MTDWRRARIVAFDTETTGLLAWDGDRVMEFGAVVIEVDDELRLKRVERHGWLINPGVTIPRDSSRVTGITDDQVTDKPPFEKRAHEVRAILADAIVVAHNLPFDLAFLKSELERAGSSWPPTRAEIDTLVCSQIHLPELKGHRLGEVAHALKIELQEAHRAVNDAEACGLAFVEMARRFGAPADMDGMIEWADGVGPPPETGHLALGARGSIEFLDGPYAGQAIEAHADHLHWMTFARTRIDGGWMATYPDSLSRWARRWLRVRASGRSPQGAKGGGPLDWNLDPV